jgi:hypothetical protein
MQALLAAWFRLVSCSAYSSALKMEATCSSETSVDFERTTRRSISEDRTLRNHRENLKSYICILLFIELISSTAVTFRNGGFPLKPSG